MSATLTVAVIGGGNIGGTVGRAAARAGHQVTFGSRHPDSDTGPGQTGARATDVAQALAGAEVVVLAVPGKAVPALVAEHADALAGALVIDATNSMGGTSSNQHAAITPVAGRYARCFNTLGVENLEDPRFGTEVADMFFSAPAADRPVVEALIDAVGLRPVYLGADQHETVDMVLKLWFALAIGQQRGRNLAFRVLER
jgi:8-hydroxy-5-deazaflavin:NADPH oxidoreductase